MLPEDAAAVRRGRELGQRAENPKHSAHTSDRGQHLASPARSRFVIKRPPWPVHRLPPQTPELPLHERFTGSCEAMVCSRKCRSVDASFMHLVYMFRTDYRDQSGPLEYHNV